MFCSKCGKELLDEAVVCPNCGCTTSNYTTQPQPPLFSKDYLAIKEFYTQATTLRNLGIAAAVLMFGIGIFFSIMIWVKLKNIQIPEVQTTNPNEIAEFEMAKRHYKTATSLASLPILGIALSFIIGGVIGMSINM